MFPAPKAAAGVAKSMIRSAEKAKKANGGLIEAMLAVGANPAVQMVDTRDVRRRVRERRARRVTDS